MWRCHWGCARQWWKIPGLLSQEFNPLCSESMFALGCSTSLFLHYCHLWLDFLLPTSCFGDFPNIARRVPVDQLVASPMLCVWYFLGIGSLED